MIEKNMLALAFCILITSISIADTTETDIYFPTPEILKENVAFWKKIYTEISTKEGLIHDRDYPGIIYEKVTGNYKSPNVKDHKEKIINSLNIITSQPESTWTKKEIEIHKLFKKYAPDDIQGAQDRVRFQMGQMDRFQEGLQRSGMYIDTIYAIFKQYGIPKRLIYLPHVESSFNTEAYSKVGAAGLWQFMRGTGRLYGMKIDYTIDERRDPVVATIAAAKYLSSSYDVFKSWPLAITSYNHGVYGVKRAVKQTGSNDLAVIIQKYSSRSFKFASSNFYGCFLAASEIAENHKNYFPSVSLKPRLEYSDITLTHYVGPDILCKYLGIPREVFSDLNPAIRPAMFEGHKELPKGLSIHIPANISTEVASNALLTIPDSLKATDHERPQYYRVNSGDNLNAISVRLGVSVQELAFENNITKLNRIREGQVLRVPGHKKTAAQPTTQALAALSLKEEPPKKAIKEATVIESTSIEAVVEIAQAEAQSAIPPDEVSVKGEATVVIPPESVKKTKTETPSQLPKPVQTAISDSLREIIMAPAIVVTEKEPTKKPDILSGFDVTLYHLDVALSAVGNNAELQVSVDETIGHYADWLKIPTSRIRKLNQMGSTSDIRLNKRLLIPVEHEDALEKFVAARLEYHMAIEEDFYTQFKVTDVKSHTVQKGQTLWDLCNGSENPLPMWLLKKHNKNLDLGKLIPGVIVWIPQIEEKTEEEMIDPVKKNQDPSNSNYSRSVRIKAQEIKRVP